MSTRAGVRVGVVLVVMVVLLGLMASSASAEVAGPAWAVRSVAVPTNFTQTDSEACEPLQAFPCDGYIVTVTNVGSVASSGTLTVMDRLPAGVVLAEVGAARDTENAGGGVSCSPLEGPASVVTCTDVDPIGPASSLSLTILVRANVGFAPVSVVNVVEAEGGGALRVVSGAPTTLSNVVNGPAAVFGVQEFSANVLGAGGAPDVEAGGHPSSVVTYVNYTTVINPTPGESDGSLAFVAVQEPKTQIVDLPLGLVGDPSAVPECPEARLRDSEENPEHPCPVDSVVGEVKIEQGDFPPVTRTLIYNMVPEPGYPAVFAFEFSGALVYLRARVLPSAAGYVVSVSAPDIVDSETVKVTGVTVTFFGDPVDRAGGSGGEEFLSNPDDCQAGPLSARLEMDSWVDPEPAAWPSAEAPFFEASPARAVTGCGGLSFQPSIAVSPEESTVDTPSGYEVLLRVPQALNLPGYRATPDLRDAVLTLPEGVSVSPSAANGLVACQVSGGEGIELGAGDTLAADDRVQEGEEVGADGLVHPAAGHCPAASQVGEVEVFTPILKDPLRGHVFVSEPLCGGGGQPACTEASAADGELFGLYLEVAGAGVVVKMKGQVSVNPRTGQITTSFREAPQFPFSELKLRLNGGSRAPLANPQGCGVFTATSDFTAWSSPETPDATPFSSFPIGCGGVGGFAPNFLAGTATTAADVFSPFSLTFSRRDGEQDLGGLSVVMPEGLLGRIAGVVLCGEVQANAGSCPVGSRVGVATAAAGAGGTPFWQSGPVFLTGPYGGGPFGLAVVVPADAGPYHLGNIVVRAAIHINPVTAAVSVVSNPLPQMIDGVPLRVQTVNVTVGGERAFTFNPTSCAGKAVSGTITGTGGASVGVSSPFAATGCAALPFKPVFTASTRGSASKVDGASLDSRVVFPAPPAGSSAVGVDANVASFKVELPRQLPSRLTTLQKACLAATFEANPASCPAASDVGSVLVDTPVLSSPLAGPAYLVSYGGEKFPQLVMVLQGEGVTIQVTGTIFVSKQSITSVTLKATPDAPFTSFELKTPEGRYSALTANVPEKDEFNLCGQKLLMPTVITGQNGAVVKQSTVVSVTGCAKAKKQKPKKAKAKKAGKAGKARKAGAGAGHGRGEGRRA
jgi:uncharacterized repeat protein (TIGR01451 family)